MPNTLVHVPGTAESPFPQRPIVHYEDWRAFVARPGADKPRMPSPAEYSSMNVTEKKAFDRQRIQYQRTFGPIVTPIMKKIHDDALRLATINLKAGPGARPGIIIDGVGTIGKSTTAMHLGRRYEQALTKNHTIEYTPTGHHFIPVAYVNLPGETTISNFNWLLADFYNVPAAKSTKAPILTKKIIDYAANCCTSMMILDDIHFLKMHNRSAEALNNHLKSLANSISATFIYAGIDCTGTGLLTEGYRVEKVQFSQTRHRFKIFEMYPFSITKEEGRASYQQVLEFIESNLLLLKQPPGALFESHGSYIIERTGGFMGAIMTLLREAGHTAIMTGQECITQNALQNIKLDFDSEERFKQYQARRKAMSSHSKE